MTCTDDDVADVVTWLRSAAAVMSRIGQVSMCFRSDMINFRKAAELLTSLSAERDRLDGEIWIARVGACDLHARAERAEAERDAIKALWAEAEKRLLFTGQTLAQTVQELSALKARAAGVLEPFAKANDQWLAIVSPDLPDGHELNVMGSTVGHFRRASELHATLSGDRNKTT